MDAGPECESITRFIVIIEITPDWGTNYVICEIVFNNRQEHVFQHFDLNMLTKQ